MLVQWRYKIKKKFADCKGELFTGRSYNKYRRTKPRPVRMFLYKPSKKKYDYFDYSGTAKNGGTEVSDTTCTLELLGYIKFIEKKNCDKRSFA
jgi:hypothetical protein